MIKVLFISQWYPHRYDLMAGLFVQKHAKAVSLYCEVKVLYVYADENIDNFEIKKSSHLNFSEVVVYYPNKKNKLFYKFIKTINYLLAYWKGYKEIKIDGFIPDIVHSNILTRTAFVAYLHKIWKGIPYVITEHWSRYLPNRNAYNGFLRKKITELVVKNAKAVLPVSENLMHAMKTHNLQNSNYKVINNVVNDYFIEEISVVHRLKKRIIHVSCFDEEAKNVSGILRATYALSKIRQDFELIIIGKGVDYEKIYVYAQTLNFHPGIIHFMGEKTPEEVANWLQNSDFFVLFSNFENSPVVISESLVCGKPVLSTDVGGISELVNSSNGILIKAGNEVELREKMNYLLDHHLDYDSEKIKQEAIDKFSYKTVGMKLTEIYRDAII